ncbi:hypothetical protein [Nitrosococcus wardiae]|uniref:Uncharacterized protein n=1 Tax=Nitrosococcus wardiae TaxID=1814290 RepID=A0A4V1AWB7_9GAMM|nr:hypothetical protein [Nitrosococcus wardiae]QBQ56075.1 hypothetical protein E3U44_17335 [Nitrosococcus wardiae]
MFKDEDLIDELCTELQQLCTELEKVKTVSEENRGRGITESRRRQHIDYTIDRTRAIKEQEP